MGQDSEGIFQMSFSWCHCKSAEGVCGIMDVKTAKGDEPVETANDGSKF